MWIFDIIDIILVVVIILCELFLYAFSFWCRIAYKKGFEDGKENSWRKQPFRDIDKINKLKEKQEK